MKKINVIYWVTTGLISAGMLFSAFLYLSQSAELVESFKSIGFPLHFVILLGVAKLAGAIILVSPVFNRLKEWTYAGFVFTFVGALWTHIATHTPWVAPMLFLVVLSVSYYTWLRREHELHPQHS